MTYSQADITVPYAVANFAEIRHKGYYYVDKTTIFHYLSVTKHQFFSVLADSERVCSFPCWLTITTATWQHNSKIDYNNQQERSFLSQSLICPK